MSDMCLERKENVIKSIEELYLFYNEIKDETRTNVLVNFFHYAFL